MVGLAAGGPTGPSPSPRVKAREAFRRMRSPPGRAATGPIVLQFLELLAVVSAACYGVLLARAVRR